MGKGGKSSRKDEPEKAKLDKSAKKIEKNTRAALQAEKSAKSRRRADDDEDDDEDFAGFVNQLKVCSFLALSLME